MSRSVTVKTSNHFDNRIDECVIAVPSDLEHPCCCLKEASVEFLEVTREDLGKNLFAMHTVLSVLIDPVQG